MKRPGPVSRFAAPLKLLAHRFNFLFLIAAAVGLMVLGKAETAFVERMRMLVADAHRFRVDDAAERKHGDLGRAAADVDDH